VTVDGRLVVLYRSGKLDFMALAAMLNAFTCSRKSSGPDGPPRLASLILPVMFRVGADSHVVMHWFYFTAGTLHGLLRGVSTCYRR
jgi:hypothetical protein